MACARHNATGSRQEALPKRVLFRPTELTVRVKLLPSTKMRRAKKSKITGANLRRTRQAIEVPMNTVAAHSFCRAMHEKGSMAERLETQYIDMPHQMDVLRAATVCHQCRETASLCRSRRAARPRVDEEDQASSQTTAALVPARRMRVTRCRRGSENSNRACRLVAVASRGWTVRPTRANARRWRALSYPSSAVWKWPDSPP